MRLCMELVGVRRGEQNDGTKDTGSGSMHRLDNVLSVSSENGDLVMLGSDRDRRRVFAPADGMCL